MCARKYIPESRTIREPASMVLGFIICQLREQRGWSQTELAHRSGLKRQSIAKIETSEHRQLSDSIEWIAQAFGMAGSALMAMAEQHVRHWPPECEGCNYSCVENGVLRDLNSRGECTRPSR